MHLVLARGADRDSPPASAATVTEVDPAVALTSTWEGVPEAAHTQVSTPTTAAPSTPSSVVIRGLVSTLGAGIAAASTAARARVTGSTTGSGAARWPSGSHTHILSASDSSVSWF